MDSHVIAVSLMRIPAQIIKVTILSIPIVVASFFALRAGTDECFEN
jgi:hypothetical protein